MWRDFRGPAEVFGRAADGTRRLRGRSAETDFRAGAPVQRHRLVRDGLRQGWEVAGFEREVLGVDLREQIREQIRDEAEDRDEVREHHEVFFHREQVSLYSLFARLLV